MKTLLVLSLFLGLSVSALAQEVIIDTSYYTPPSQRRRVLTADPEQSSDLYRPNRERPGSRRKPDYLTIYEPREIQTWYVNLEGGFRSDGSILSNSFDGLVSSPTTTKTVWGALLGYTYQNAWAVEVGYMQAPTHLTIGIANSPNPFTFNYQTSGHSIPVRLKRRIGSGKKATNSAGFWLSAGAWLIPNGDSQTNDFKLQGYSSRTRRSRVDTLGLTNSTTTTSHLTGLAEVGVDYAARLSSFLELSFYARKYWGLGNAIRADMVYTVNTTSPQKTTITADGTGWGFGITLRYIYSKQHELKNP